MRKNLSTFCLLLAWFCATGAVTEVAQIFAWGRMFVGYVRVLPVGEALTETFDAEKPCALCLVVKKSRATGDNQSRAAVADAEKILLGCSVSDPIVFSPPVESWPATPHWQAIARSEAVPTRPPRA